MKSKLPNNWTYAEFHAFVMLYAANADSRITAEETALIRPTLSEKQYVEIETAFNESSDATVLDHILSYRTRYFSTQDERDRLLADMQTIFDADTRFTIMERSLKSIFQRLV
jgi:hypothetical protein